MISSVVWNALFLDPGVSGGTETYLVELGEAMFAAYPAVRFSVVTTGPGAVSLRERGWEDAATVYSLPCEYGQRLRRTLAEQLALPIMSRRARPDVIHSLANLGPVFPPIPSVLTIHDATFLSERAFGLVSAIGMRSVSTRASQRADRIITGSQAARDEICRVMEINPQRVSVVPHGPGHSPGVAPAALDDVRQRYRLMGHRVILCVGSKRPHKNQAVLIHALQGLNSDLVLALVGRPESCEVELRKLAAGLGLSHRVRFIDYARPEVLEALWQVADVAAIPSLAEGFGLPLLEALDRGVPVACSDLPVLHEVGGSTPSYFDPRDPASAAHAVAEAIVLEPRLLREGQIHARRFTWASAARGTMTAYELAVAGGHPRCT